MKPQRPTSAHPPRPSARSQSAASNASSRRASLPPAQGGPQLTGRSVATNASSAQRGGGGGATDEFFLTSIGRAVDYGKQSPRRSASYHQSRPGSAKDKAASSAAGSLYSFDTAELVQHDVPGRPHSSALRPGSASRGRPGSARAPPGGLVMPSSLRMGKTKEEEPNAKPQRPSSAKVKPPPPADVEATKDASGDVPQQPPAAAADVNEALAIVAPDAPSKEEEQEKKLPGPEDADFEEAVEEELNRLRDDDGVDARPTTTGGSGGNNTNGDPDAAVRDAVRLAMSKRPTLGRGNAPPVAPDDEAEIAKMRTAEDVVSFFSTHSRTYTPVKFVIMARPPQPPGSPYRPYDLVTAGRGSVDRADYYVVTASAVVHMIGGQPTDVTLLADFVRDASLFSVISRIRFFRHYLALKALRQWHRNVRLKNFCQVRRRLCQQFFVSKETFAKPLMELKRRSHDLMSHSLIALPQGREGIAKEKFIEFAAKHRSEVSSTFHDTLSDVEESLVNLCNAAVARAKIPDLATPEALNQYLLALEEEELRHNGTKRVNPKAVSMVVMRERTRARMRALRSSMDDVSLLPGFVRLVDQMCAQALFRNGLLALETLLNELARTDDERLIFFITAVTFQGSTDGINFHPGRDDFNAMLKDIESEVTGAVASAPRIAQARSLKEHFDIAPKLLGMGQAIQRDDRVVKLRTASKAVIANDFVAADEATKSYARNRKWYTFLNTEWPATRLSWQARWAREQKAGSLLDAAAPDQEPLTAAEFSNIFRTVDEAHSRLADMHPVRRGCLSVTSANILDILMTKLKELTADARQLLTEVANLRIERLSQAYMVRVKSVVDRPTTLKKYAGFATLLNEVVDESTRLDEVADETAELFDVAEMNQGEGMTLEVGRRAMILGGPAGGNGQPQQQNAVRDRYANAVEAAKDFRTAALKDMSRKLEQEIEAEKETVFSTMAMVDSSVLTAFTTDTGEVMNYLDQLEQAIDTSSDKMRTFVQWQKLFGVGNDDMSSVDQLRGAFKSKRELWKAIERWNHLHVEYYTAPIADLDINVYAKEVDELYVQAYSKLHPKHKCEASERVLEELKEEKMLMPVLQQFGNHNLRPQHWAVILSNQQRPYDPTISLDALRQLKMFDPQYRELVAEQSAIATGEANLITTVESLRDRWDRIDFEVKPHRDTKDAFILDDVSDIVAQLEEDVLVVQSCLASRFVAGIRGKVQDWEQRLVLLGQVIEEWVYVQGNWMYLEFIFQSDDIKKQLPAESSAFKSTAADFKELINRAKSLRNAIVVATEADVLETLQEAHANLDHILRKIEEYLETKRAAFPRFYFLSNDELLSILSDSRDTRAVRPHLRKCFDSIKDLDFTNDAGTELGAMISAEGEYVPFSTTVAARGPVENWLLNVEKMMVASLQDHTRMTAKAQRNEPKRTNWILSVQDANTNVIGLPAQCIQCVDMVDWTRQVEVAIDDGPAALNKFYDEYKSTILDTVAVVRQDLSRLKRSLVGTLLVVDVHNRDVIGTLVEKNVGSVADFTWLMQLRYYMDPGNGHVSVRHVDAAFNYSYEYLGSSPRLVITPLTDRAFLTCTSALHMHLGGAPQGPAGTGKTESVKDLGKALARQVVVFNCSDGINTNMMSQMFAGLAQGGAWACFDEFNRIELEVLSVVAQQMLEITTAIAKKQTAMVFDGHDIRLHPNFGVFITMNPGYAGRTELPDNLKALFRPVCMMVPDYRLIAEIMFFSEGFNNAAVLSRKMVLLYRLSSEQLSKQDHYDFGMRAVKSILVMAGSLKRAEPDADEDMLLIRAMRDSNVPKFLRDDAVLFNALISDLYPNTTLVDKTNEVLTDAIHVDLKAHGLQPVEKFVGKVLQLHETMLVRHGVMMVGRTLTGKSTCFDTLQRSLTTMHATEKQKASDDDDGNASSHPYVQPTHQHVVNPKSISRDELYGAVNATTREWTDGCLSKIVRHVVDAANKSDDRHWIVFDGPVDAVWIENMNTVLDDNKMLCLVNGERLKIPDTVTCCFEVQDLRHASPATVSRCGMVYIEPFYIDGGWRPLLQSGCAALAKQHGAGGPDASSLPWNADVVFGVLEQLIDALMSHPDGSHCHEWIPTVPGQRVQGTLHLLASLLEHVDDHDDDAKPPSLPPAEVNEDGIELPIDAAVIDVEVKNAADIPADVTRVDDVLLRKLAIFAFIWGFGGNVCEKGASRQRFSSIVLPELRKIDPNFPDLEGGEAKPTTAGDGAAHTVFDLRVRKCAMAWVPWSTVVPQFVFRRCLPFFDLMVPTSETVATQEVVAALLAGKHHVLLNGTTGTSKSAGLQTLIFDRLRTEDPSSPWQSFSMVLSAQTSSKQLQEKFESKLRNHPSRKGHLCVGPAQGKRMVAFVDDLNMPLLEEYGASPPAELLRQLIVQGGCFDRKKMVWKDVIDLVHLAACGPPGGGKNELTQRLTSRYFTLCQPALSTSSMHKVFHSILKGFLGAHHFADDVAALASDVAYATLDAYRETASTRLPTPAKSHYTFSMRDVSRVVQGISQVVPSVVRTKADMVQLWAHESSRVFHDRLVDETDRQWWWESQRAIILRRFHVESPDDERREIMYGDFGNLDDENQAYSPMAITSGLHEILMEKMMAYGLRFSREMDLVLFDNAVRHLARVCRILRQPRGHALLVGVGGSGRSSLARLGAFIVDCKGFTITVSRTYGVTDFREDLRKVLLETGTENRHTALIIADTQLVEEQFLEDLNNLLNSGEVANVYQPEDYERMMASVRDAVAAAGKPETQNVLLAHFTSVCRDNLHVVLTMSPAGDVFRQRIRMFPSLTSCMTIDWYMPWPESALLSVAGRLLADLAVESEHQRAALCKLCVAIHESVKIEADRYHDELRRRAYTTPTSYLSLLNLVGSMVKDQSEKLEGDVLRFRGGLEKIRETNTKVDEMKKSLITMQPLLEERSVETSKFAKEVEEEKQQASEVQAVVAVEEKACSEIMAEATAIKDDCQAELDRAMPAYHEAVEALNALNPKDINEAKAYSSPPKKVELVLNAVLTILEEGTGWDNARRIMSKNDFIQTLKNFDKDHVPNKVLQRLKKFINDDDFRPEAVQNVSKACVSLCLWCRAIDNYCEVMKVVNPKKEKLAEAEAKLAKARGELEEKQSELRTLEAKIADLQAQYEGSIRRKQQLEAEMEKTQLYLNRAERLLTGLADEYERWGKTAVQLTDKKPFVVVTAVLSAAMTAYGGPFTAPFRLRLLERWMATAKGLSLITPDTFQLSDVVDAVVIRSWRSHGLPGDQMSVENATILSKSRRWCLCIDPQGQANAWIRRTYGDKGLKVLKTGDPNFMRTIEDSIRLGTPVLYENVGEAIDASLDPLLQKQVYRQGAQLMIRIRDAAVDYDPNFLFIMTTRLPNPHYLPEIQIKVTLLNFAVTFHGLEDQLLGEVVRHERPDLEERSDRIVVQVADARGQLTEVEDKILRLMSTASGDVLENEVLITTLKQSKETSNEIAENLRVAERTQAEIRTAREEYRPVATRGSIAFTAITDISSLEHMYQYSLSFFVKLFKQTLARTGAADSVSARCEKLIDATTVNSFNGVCRGMFEHHKPVFAVLLAVAVSRHEEAVSPQEWNLFLRGAQGALPEDPSVASNPVSEWLSDEKWDELVVVAESSAALKNAVLHDGILEDPDNWRDFARGKADLPRSIQGGGCTPFQQLLLVRTLREESLFDACRDFVQARLGSAFVKYETFDLNASFADSSPYIPIVIVLSPGTDPTSNFTAFAESRGFGNKIKLVSMGQGQGDRAEAFISQARQSGEWVYLQNCHVYTTWMPRLEALVAETAATAPHPDYRLWLTTMPSPSFPVPVLQASLKLTREPPKGLRANMLDTFSNAIDDSRWLECAPNRLTWRRMLFGLTLFHGATQERRKFGPLGWNIRYEWNSGDLDASVIALQSYVERLSPADDPATALPWDAIRYMVGNINYGGRVTDDWDRRCLDVLMRRFVRPDVVGSDLMGQSVSFSPNDPSYVVPSALDDLALGDVRERVAQLPDEHPAMYGLHGNATLTLDAQRSKQLHQWVVDVQPRVGGGGGAASAGADVVGTLVAEFRQRMPLPIDRSLAHQDTYRVLPESGVMTSLGTVCDQEVECCNRLIAYLNRRLTALDAAMRGELVMDASLEKMHGSLLFAQVPVDWEKQGYPSLKPLGSWFADFILRVEFFRDWNDTGIPTSCWLGAFFFPQGFLTGVLQTHSRQYKVPIDSLRFVVHPTAETDAAVAELPIVDNGIYVHGLSLEGARWDVPTGGLAEPRPRELFSPMPILHMEPVTDAPGQHESEQGRALYECPVYKIASRAGVLSTTGISSNFVQALRISAGAESPEHWILRGAALITTLSE